MDRQKLDDEQIAERLKKLDGWEVAGNRLKKRYKFDDFASSLEFVNTVGRIAEDRDHHPDITFGWGYAEIALTTHDRGGLTEFDFAVAKAIGNILNTEDFTAEGAKHAEILYLENVRPLRQEIEESIRLLTRLAAAPTAGEPVDYLSEVDANIRMLVW